MKAKAITFVLLLILLLAIAYVLPLYVNFGYRQKLLWWLFLTFFTGVRYTIPLVIGLIAILVGNEVSIEIETRSLGILKVSVSEIGTWTVGNFVIAGSIYIDAGILAYLLDQVLTI